MIVDLERLLDRISDGSAVALAPDYSGCAMTAVRGLIRRGARDLHLLAVPQAGFQADMLIGAGCVASVEAAAITLYTMECELYRTLNRLLRARDRQQLRPFFSYLRLLLQARAKLPKHAGSLWRGVKGVDLRSKFPQGKELWWWAFTSTTKALSTLSNDMFLGKTGVRTVFMIETSSGVDIMPYSIFQGDASEAEVPHEDEAAGGVAISFLKEQQWPIDFGVAKAERRAVARADSSEVAADQ